LRLNRTLERFEDCSVGVSRLCFFKTLRSTPRYVLAESGRDGCESLLKYEEKENEEVVGSVNGKGILRRPSEDYSVWSIRRIFSLGAKEFNEYLRKVIEV